MTGHRAPVPRPGRRTAVQPNAPVPSNGTVEPPLPVELAYEDLLETADALIGPVRERLHSALEAEWGNRPYGPSAMARYAALHIRTSNPIPTPEDMSALLDLNR